MKERIERRLQQLRAEYRKGEERLVELEHESSSVNSSMLRISGAIQILEELLEQDPSKTPGSSIQEPPLDSAPIARSELSSS